MSDSSDEERPGIVIEEALPYRWDRDSRRIVPIRANWGQSSEASGSEWTVVAGGRGAVQNWQRIVTSVFAIRQLQQWFSASGTALQWVNPALRDRISRKIGR